MWFRTWCGLLVTMIACTSDDSTSGTTDTPADAVGDSAADSPEDTAVTAPDTDDSAEPAETVEADTAPDLIGPGGCFTLSLSGHLAPHDSEGVFRLGGDVDLGLGGPLPDAVVFEFYADETGEFDLGANGNENYKTCTQCVRFVQDIDRNAGGAADNFFQRAGTITIDPATPPFGRQLRVTLSDLEMEEVSIRAVDFQSTPVPDGSCYRGAEPIVLETGDCVPECGAHVCGPDGCGGFCGPGCEDGELCRLDGSGCDPGPRCVQVAVTGPLDNTASGVFRLDVSEHGLGAVGGSDLLQIEFYQSATGTFDLGTAPNRNYATCKQCLRMVVDGRRELFQRRGKIVVAETSVPLGSPELDGYVSLETQGVVLEEVLIDDLFNTMPLPDGGCVELVDGVLASELPAP